MIPGQPVHDHRGIVLEKTEYLSDHLLVAADHAVSIHHRFRHGRGSGCEKKFGHAVGNDFLVSGSDARRWSRLQQIGEGACLAAVRWRGRGDDLDVFADRGFDRRGVSNTV